MLAFMVDQGELAEDTVFPWQHHQFKQFPAHIRDQLDHARNFSEVIHGAALLYNLMLAEARGDREWEEVYTERLEEWAENIATHREQLMSWNRDSFWEIIASDNQRVPHLTRIFINSWIDLVLSQAAPKTVRSAIRSHAVTVARGFRHFFNTPESMALVRSMPGPTKDQPYWRRDIEYAANGCLQATLDECAHILRESLGLLDSPLK